MDCCFLYAMFWCIRTVLDRDPGSGLSAGADAHSGSSDAGWADMGIDPIRQSFLLTVNPSSGRLGCVFNRLSYPTGWNGGIPGEAETFPRKLHAAISRLNMKTA